VTVYGAFVAADPTLDFLPNAPIFIASSEGAKMIVSKEVWRVPVRLEDIPETGRTFALSADPSTLAAIARAAGVNGVSRLDAAFDVFRQGEGVKVTGTVAATVQQTCVVTLDPIENEVQENVDLLFSPRVPASSSAIPTDETDAPEPLIDGSIDLGAIATEFLILGIDPYPRKQGAVFAQQHGGASEAPHNPFAALAALKKNNEPR
jgi:uncharacterized metal-binding protein YceD (DUF177 family)